MCAAPTSDSTPPRYCHIQQAQTSLPSTGDSAELLPGGGGGTAALATAEFNTTLRLADRIRRLEQHEPDLTQLAEQRLQQSSCSAQQLRNKVSAAAVQGQSNVQQLNNKVCPLSSSCTTRSLTPLSSS